MPQARLRGHRAVEPKFLTQDGCSVQLPGDRRFIRHERKHGIAHPHVFHAGDGNIHPWSSTTNAIQTRWARRGGEAIRRGTLGGSVSGSTDRHRKADFIQTILQRRPTPCGCSERCSIRKRVQPHKCFPLEALYGLRLEEATRDLQSHDVSDQEIDKPFAVWTLSGHVKVGVRSRTRRASGRITAESAAGLCRNAPAVRQSRRSRRRTNPSCRFAAVHPVLSNLEKTFPEEALRELADSIREQGIVQPLIVRERGDGFELIAGERRWRAAQMLGLPRCP